MKKLSALALALGTSLAGGALHAQSIECGQNYTVQRGDFLSAIAQRAYGQAQAFTQIYRANSRVIGPDPALIRVGMSLQIPCLDSALVPSTANTETVGRAETVEALPGPSEDRPIRVLTATDWAPFTNEEQDQGGMLTEIINVALDQADGDPEYQIDFVNDWGAHLQPLVSDHAYDFSIGWKRPTCELVENLDDESKFRCNNLDYTEALYEQVLGFFSTAEGGVYTQHSDMLGKNICRPAGYTISDLIEVGLEEPDVTMVRALSPEACVESLASGESDIALLDIDAANVHIAELGIQDDIVLSESLNRISSLHAVIAKTHPNGQDLIDTVNSGLRKMKDSGQWFEIVRRHLTEHRQKSQS